MRVTCRHYIIKPFLGGDGRLRGLQEETRFSKDGKEYCTHANSLHLPGTPLEVTCGGDAAKCDIPRGKR